MYSYFIDRQDTFLLKSRSLEIIRDMKLFAQPRKTLRPKVDAKQVTIIKTCMLKVSKP